MRGQLSPNSIRSGYEITAEASCFDASNGAFGHFFFSLGFKDVKLNVRKPTVLPHHLEAQRPFSLRFFAQPERANERGLGSAMVAGNGSCPKVRNRRGAICVGRLKFREFLLG